MAAETDKIVDVIVNLATAKPAPKFNEARNKLDAALLGIKEAGGDEKKFLKETDKALKKKSLNIAKVLKGDVMGEHELVYDAFGDAMEPTYYWILDFIRDQLGYDVEKTSDFFAASEASSYFGEIGQRRTALESRLAGGGNVPGLFGTINMVVKSIINLLYDLKTFDLRLKHYDDLKSKDPLIKKTACEALKGIWLNEVDKTKGNAAIDVLAQQLNFITLRDSFMVVPVQDWYVHDADTKKTGEIKEKVAASVQKMDLTDVVKRILAPRAKEFVDWLYLSEKELRMRRSVERAYLKAQNSALEAYARWARPYLIATEKLMPTEYAELLKEHKEMGLGPAAIPKQFHAMWFYLELVCKKASKIELRAPFDQYSELKLKDETYRPLSIINIRFAFRGSPQTVRGQRGEPITVNTGRILIKFTGYAMQQKHFDLLMRMQDSEVLDFIDVMTKESFDAMSKDLQKYLEEEKPAEEPKPKSVFDLPFSAFIKPIFGSVKKFNVQAKGVLKKMPKLNLPSNEVWNIARLKLVAQEKAKKDTNTVFRVYRLTNKMLAAPESKQ
jgi:hypothetical protein